MLYTHIVGNGSTVYDFNAHNDLPPHLRFPGVCFSFLFGVPYSSIFYYFA